MDNQNPQNASPKAQVVDRIKQANNVLVTVSASPSVDQLAAAIGLTLLLNKLGKHGTAVFSGDVPPAIQFLEPEKTLEKNTDSLRDFIIALDKAKADKLRYKVEENVVKIFITPYRTSISEKDLDFSQGDFNVDVVIALGVKEQTQLDQAITAHGRILHDATVVSVNNGQGGELGSIHWEDATASSLSEMVVTLGGDLDKKLLDGQIATALLTGIVAETKRFSNEKTTPKTMSVSAELMAAGANQQLVATKLREAATPPKPADSGQLPQGSGAPTPPSNEPPKPRDGTLEITHDKNASENQDGNKPAPQDKPNDKGPDVGQIHVDDEGNLHALDLPNLPGAVAPAPSDDSRTLLTQPPSMGGTLTASSHEEGNDPTTDALSLPPPVDAPFLSHGPSNGPLSPAPDPGAAASSDKPLTDDETLIDIEKQVDSPHLAEEASEAAGNNASSGAPASDLDHARDAVQAAINSDTAPSNPLPPISALNAQPVFDELHETAPSQTTGTVQATMPDPTAQSSTPELAALSDQTPGTLNMPMPSASFPSNIAPPPEVISPTDSQNDPSAPPPVPPPIGFGPPPQ